MMMRPIERGIFDRTKAWLEAFPNERFLVVLDEAHLYRGATASFSAEGQQTAGHFGAQLAGADGLLVGTERDAIEAGYVQPWQHTNAKRTPERRAYRLRRLHPRKAPCPAGQLALLREIERPVSRLHEFGGGMVPPSVAIEIEFHRRRLGLSQRQLGVLIGRSQGQISNALRGRYPISSSSVNRLREALQVDRGKMKGR
jgi:hypothetical protein